MARAATPPPTEHDDDRDDGEIGRPFHMLDPVAEAARDRLGRGRTVAWSGCKSIVALAPPIRWGVSTCSSYAGPDAEWACWIAPQFGMMLGWSVSRTRFLTRRTTRRRSIFCSPRTARPARGRSVVGSA